MWLGPAKERDFNNVYALNHGEDFTILKRSTWNWSCHTLDGPFWAMDLGMPHTIDVETVNPRTEHGLFLTIRCNDEFKKRKISPRYF